MTDAATQPSASTRRSPKVIVLCSVALAALTWLDLWTKDIAQAELSREPLVPAGEVCVADDEGRVFMQRIQTAPHVLLPGYLEFRYAENCGAAFGVLDRGPAWMRLALFGPAAIAATVGLFWLLVTGYGGTLFAISVPLIASGALGNLIDRLRFGYVVDFIRFHVQDAFVYPTFNVADCTITIGVVLLFIESLRTPRTNAASQMTATPANAEAKTPR